MPWKTDLAIQFLKNHAAPHSLGHCAQYVREAIEAGGVVLHRHNSAKDYGTSLTGVGFRPLASNGAYLAFPGDVGVIQPIKGHPHGHIAMFDGSKWISDFVQQHGLYPGHGYRTAKPSYTIYRYPLMWTGPDSAPMTAGLV